VSAIPHAGITPNTEHPAKFSAEILTQLRVLCEREAQRLGRPPLVLDPFAGVGRIHELGDVADTVGIELEPEWAACHPRTIAGDATDLPASWADHFDMIVTSPCYGNRMADCHDAKDKCKTCGGTGRRGQSWCTMCKGKGLSMRKNYRTALGRMPSDGSAAVMQWGDKYRDLHRRALAEMIRVVEPGGLVVVNMSNHFRRMPLGEGRFGSQVVRVVEWWVETMMARGLLVEAVLPVATKRHKNGANRDLRWKVEQIIAMRKPLPLEESTP
jgi:hypothetical protein